MLWNCNIYIPQTLLQSPTGSTMLTVCICVSVWRSMPCSVSRQKVRFSSPFFAQKFSHLSLRLAALVWSSSLSQFYPGRFLLHHHPLPSAWACHHLTLLSLRGWLTFRPPPQCTVKCLRSKSAQNTMRVGHDTNIRGTEMKHHAGMDTCWNEAGTFT